MLFYNPTILDVKKNRFIYGAILYAISFLCLQIVNETITVLFHHLEYIISKTTKIITI